jgi:hypothetical protein
MLYGDPHSSLHIDLASIPSTPVTSNLSLPCTPESSHMFDSATGSPPSAADGNEYEDEVEPLMNAALRRFLCDEDLPLGLCGAGTDSSQPNVFVSPAKYFGKRVYSTHLGIFWSEGCGSSRRQRSWVSGTTAYHKGILRSIDAGRASCLSAKFTQAHFHNSRPSTTTSLATSSSPASHILPERMLDTQGIWIYKKFGVPRYVF